MARPCGPWVPDPHRHPKRAASAMQWQLACYRCSSGASRAPPCGDDGQGAPGADGARRASGCYGRCVPTQRDAAMLRCCDALSGGSTMGFVCRMLRAVCQRGRVWSTVYGCPAVMDAQRHDRALTCPLARSLPFSPPRDAPHTLKRSTERLSPPIDLRPCTPLHAVCVHAPRSTRFRPAACLRP